MGYTSDYENDDFDEELLIPYQYRERPNKNGNQKVRRKDFYDWDDD